MAANSSVRRSEYVIARHTSIIALPRQQPAATKKPISPSYSSRLSSTAVVSPANERTAGMAVSMLKCLSRRSTITSARFSPLPSRFEGALSAFSALFRSPRSSSSLVMPNISAMAGISARSGMHSSRSQRLTVLLET